MTNNDAFVVDKDTVLTELKERIDNSYYSSGDTPDVKKLEEMDRSEVYKAIIESMDDYWEQAYSDLISEVARKLEL